ncbi:hypothetical protein ABFS83_01G106900 [Erythranthe nasuta]
MPLMPSRHLCCYFFPQDRTNHCEDKLKKAKIFQLCRCFESPVDCVTGCFGRIWLPKYLCKTKMNLLKHGGSASYSGGFVLTFFFLFFFLQWTERGKNYLQMGNT